MVKNRRKTAILLLCAIIIVVLFYACLASECACHDCAGEGCVVCLQLTLTENAAKALLCLCILVFSNLLRNAFIMRSDVSREYVGLSLSPVFLKTKLTY